MVIPRPAIATSNPEQHAWEQAEETLAEDLAKASVQ